MADSFQCMTKSTTIKKKIKKKKECIYWHTNGGNENCYHLLTGNLKVGIKIFKCANSEQMILLLELSCMKNHKNLLHST